MFKTKRTRLKIASLAAAYVGTLTIFAASSNAFGTPTGVRDVHPAICTHVNDNQGTTLDNGGAFTNESTSTKSIRCPMISDDALDTDDVQNVEVWGDEGTNGANSVTCAHFPTTAGFICSASDSWGSGTIVADLSTSVWGSGSYFAYILHNLTPNSSLFGMRLED